MTRRHGIIIAFVLSVFVSTLGTGANAEEYTPSPPREFSAFPVSASGNEAWIEPLPEPPAPVVEEITVAAAPTAEPHRSEPIPGVQYPPYSSLVPGSPIAILIDKMVELEGEWVREPWTCIAWKESVHRQFNNGPTQDRGFFMITDFWWHGGFGRIGHPELMWADPYDIMNQAYGAHYIWERNGYRWKGQWASNWMCNLQ